MDAVGLTSAIAACAAAAFSGVTLVFTRFQDDKKWRRETLEGALVDFMSGSFSGVGDRARDAMIQDLAAWDYDGYGTKAEAAHARQTDALTKLRIVGSPGLVRAAVALHQADWDVQRSLLDADGKDGRGLVLSRGCNDASISLMTNDVPKGGATFGRWDHPMYPLWLAILAIAYGLAHVALGGSWRSGGIVALLTGAIAIPISFYAGWRRLRDQSR